MGGTEVQCSGYLAKRTGGTVTHQRAHVSRKNGGSGDGALPDAIGPSKKALDSFQANPKFRFAP